MKQLKLAVIALFALVTVSNVSAQDENNPWVVGLSTNVVDFYNGNDFSGQIKDLLGNKDWNVPMYPSRITLDKYLNKGFSLQLAGSINKIENLRGKNDVDFNYFALDAIVKYDLNTLFGETSWFDPYVYLGGGYTSADSKGEAMLNGGVGFNTWFNEKLGLNFQTGTKLGFADNVGTHYQTALGLVYRFGGKDTDGDGVYDKEDACPEVAGLEQFNGCPDTDGDGVKDSDDACPEVAGLAAMNGCPDADGDGISDKEDMCPNEKGTKANKGCPDADGDGVVNKNDKCPTEAGPLENAGCPWPDTDGDGVLDKDDKCSNESGTASNGGCPESLSASEIEMLAEYSKKVTFQIDRANITEASAEKLDKIYDLINPTKNVIYVIQGHTDSTGSKGYNMYLSERRAESAKAYLVAKGIDANMIETVGKGESEPITTNSNKSGRAQNRRIFIELNNL